MTAPLAMSPPEGEEREELGEMARPGMASRQVPPGIPGVALVEPVAGPKAEAQGLHDTANAGNTPAPGAMRDGGSGRCHSVAAARASAIDAPAPLPLRLLGWAAMLVVAILCVAPFAWMASTSVNTKQGIYAWPPQWIPAKPTLDNFRQVSAQINLARALLNSVVVAVAVTVLQAVLNAAGGYAFAKLEFPGRSLLFGGLLLTLMLPGQVTLIPQFLILKHLHLLNSPLGVIMPGAVAVVGLFFMRQAMLSIPDDYLEAARAEGAAEWRVFWQVAFPLAAPAATALGLFTFFSAWSDFMLPLVVLQRESAYTLPVALSVLSGQFTAEWGILTAAAVVEVTPLVVVFLLFQRRFLEGITSTSGLK